MFRVNGKRTWKRATPEVVSQLTELIGHLIEKADRTDDARDAKNFVLGAAMAVDKVHILTGSRVARKLRLPRQRRLPCPECLRRRAGL